MNTNDMIEVLKDGRINAHESAAIIAKLRAAEELAKAYTAEYNRAGAIGDKLLFNRASADKIDSLVYTLRNAGKGETG